MGEYGLPTLTWLAVSVYGTVVIFREIRPMVLRHRLRRALGVPCSSVSEVGLWGAGVGGSLAWTALLGFTALRIFS